MSLSLQATCGDMHSLDDGDFVVMQSSSPSLQDGAYVVETDGVCVVEGVGESVVLYFSSQSMNSNS